MRHGNSCLTREGCGTGDPPRQAGVKDGASPPRSGREDGVGAPSAAILDAKAPVRRVHWDSPQPAFRLSVLSGLPVHTRSQKRATGSA